MKTDIWVFAEQHNGTVLPVAFELTAEARRLADNAPGAGTEPGNSRVTAVVIGDLRANSAEDLLLAGADRVYLCTHRCLSLPMELSYEIILHRLVEEKKPEVFLFGATAFGRSLAPRLAAHLQTGLTADCTQLSIDEESGLLKQVRPAFGGSLMAEIICPDRRPQMATVRPGVFPKPLFDTSRGGLIERISMEVNDPRITLLQLETRPADRSIAEAKRLIIAGRGIGYKKNLSLVKELATLLDADWGCTRPLVENGWCDSFRQVGQTGCSVSPGLLISVGVSGAIQHTVGITGNGKRIAVNKDPSAAIFAGADYAVESDCVSFMKALCAELKAHPLDKNWKIFEEYDG